LVRLPNAWSRIADIVMGKAVVSPRPKQIAFCEHLSRRPVDRAVSFAIQPEKIQAFSHVQASRREKLTGKSFAFVDTAPRPSRANGIASSARSAMLRARLSRRPIALACLAGHRRVACLAAPSVFSGFMSRSTVQSVKAGPTANTETAAVWACRNPTNHPRHT